MSRRGLQQGFNLIELLVSILIASVGVLGFMSIFLHMNSSELETQQREEASRMSDYIVGQMRANRYSFGCYETDVYLAAAGGYVGTGYNPNTTPYNCNDFGNTETRLQVVADLMVWHGMLQGSLITIEDDSGNSINVGGIANARGCIEADTDANFPNRFFVSIAWQGTTPDQDRAGGCGEDLYYAPDAEDGDDPDDRYRRVLVTMVELPELD